MARNILVKDLASDSFLQVDEDSKGRIICSWERLSLAYRFSSKHTAILMLDAYSKLHTGEFKNRAIQLIEIIEF